MPNLQRIKGVKLASVASGIRTANRLDLTLITLHPSSITSAVFTTNQFCAAPVLIAKEHLAQNMPRALIINTGYANAGTGEQGYQDAQNICQALAELLKCDPNQILPFSTGIIGERLPVEPILDSIPNCIATLDETHWPSAAEAIMTTDTRPKSVSKSVVIEDKTLNITGISKGAGMICPNMATLLAFIATDATLSQSVLDLILKKAVSASFNSITVDGDTSTNDAVTVIASGQGELNLEQQPEALAAFEQVLTEVCIELAQAVIKDAEGATKFITIEVTGAQTDQDCKTVATTIAHSPLVKTALFAEDPNWGRIIAAIGRSNIPGLVLKKVTLAINGHPVFRNEAADSNYNESQVAAAMASTDITLSVILGSDPTTATVWTSDLSHDYVSINADYRS